MDYIIFGLGLGATLTLVGWALREWGAAFRDRSLSSEHTVLSGYELVNRMAWQRFCRSCGAVLAIFGLLVLLATIVAIALMLSNEAGVTIVLATVALCAVATLVWLGVFLQRFGSRGILRPKSTKPSPPVAVSKPESETFPGHTSGAAPVIGPPVPAGAPGAAAGQRRRAGVTALQDDDEDADTESVEDHIAVGAETGDTVEHVPKEEGGQAEGHPGDALHSAESAVAYEDDDDEDMREADVAVISEPPPEPDAGRRRIVMLTTKDDEDEQQAPHDIDPDDGESFRTKPVGQVTNTIPDEGMQARSGTDPESDLESASEGDIPSSSGRAEAVRKLRQRRIKRLTRDSSAPD